MMVSPGSMQERPLRKAAVLGAGTMGSRIAAHLANAGVAVVLLDIVPPEAAAGDAAQHEPGKNGTSSTSVPQGLKPTLIAGASGGTKVPPLQNEDSCKDSLAQRNKIVTAALDGLKKAKPAAFFDAAFAARIVPGNFEDHLALLRDCDWVIEAVAESLEIKQALLEKIAPFCRADATVTTNTSGLPVASIAAKMPPEFRRRWFGTHFFNPPRYMRLLEIIPTPEADPALMDRIAEFADKRLGKTVVRAKDTPNFIANRIGTFSILNIARLMQQQELSIEEVDALTGSAIGWPKTGTFRLADMVGIDVLGHVAANFAEQAKSIGDERADVAWPAFMQEVLNRKWLGDKTKQGFYKKEKDAEGKELRLSLDWKTLEYHVAARPKFPALEMAKNAEQTAERLRLLLAGDPRKDKAAAFYWPMLTELWTYAANRIPEIADDVVSIDQAMQAGFNWELGPFAMWDAVGVRETVEKMRAEGKPIAANVEKLLAAGHTHWYKEDASAASGRLFFDLRSGAYQPVAQPAGVATVAAMERARGVVKKNPGAALIDLGDGVACIEFRSKMNAIGGDIVRFVAETLRPESEPVRNFSAFVIGGDATNFSVGANIMQLLLAMQEEEWEEIDAEIRAFQAMTAAIKFCPRPVVTAPYGMCLGGGTEINLHAAQRQAHAELYMGLVETGVGLIPAGGGCKEMAIRAAHLAQSIRPEGRGESVEMMEAMKKTFETIAMAKVSTSVAEAHTLGFLGERDGFTMHRDRLLLDAKAQARALADAGYAPPIPRSDIGAAGENVLSTLELGVYLMRQGEFISDHDVKVASQVARVLCGGRVPAGTPLREQEYLDLEREAFLSLCGEKKTQERIAFTLKTGKPLRN